MSQRLTFALVGNPNCGKSTLFNALTGSRQRIGNWPGVTVEKKTGEYRHGDVAFQVVDLPGTYSLDVVDQIISLDERLARDYVHGQEARLIVNVVDASNLERNLYLTTELAEMGAPLLVVLNMVDMASTKGLRIDAQALSQRLGCPVVPTVASSGTGILRLKACIEAAMAGFRAARVAVTYDSELEDAIRRLAEPLGPAADQAGLSPRWLAARLLEGDDLARKTAGPELTRQADTLARVLGDDIDIRLADARYTLVNRIANDCAYHTGRVNRQISEKIDGVVLNRVLGIPIFLFMMYLMFLFTINIGGAFIDGFEQFSGALLVDGLGHLLDGWGVPAWGRFLLAQGVGAGVQVVATFIPIIGCLFLFLSVLEDSGYMARAAFVMDRLMRWLGLPGKSFVPLIVGFGCNVPAIMATRTLEHRRDRMMTMAMAPFMSCGARLPVYVLFVTAFFPDSGQNIVFGLYLIGILIAVLTGLVLKHTLLEGESIPFILELPPYHLPTIKGVLRHAGSRLRDFILRAGQVIVPMVLVLNILNSLGTDGSFGNENTEKSVLAAVWVNIAPAFSPFGLDRENWPAAVGVFTGVLAKEAVVGTLNAAYASLADTVPATAELPRFDVRESIVAALETIPANLAEAMNAWLDPLGLRTSDLHDRAARAAEQKVATGTFGAMASRFDGTAGAFAYLLFILLYMPCTAAVAAIYQEAGARWALFVGLWTTGLGYGIATLYYQSATWRMHPQLSASWVAGILSLLLLVLAAMRRHGQRLAATDTHWAPSRP